MAICLFWGFFLNIVWSNGWDSFLHMWVRDCLSLTSWKDYPFPDRLSWHLASLLKIRWPHCVGLFLDSLLQSLSSQLCVNSRNCLSHCFPVALFLWPQMASSHPYGPARNQRFEGSPCRSLELAWAAISLQDSTPPILATVASPNSDLFLFNSRWFLALWFLLLHHCLWIPPWKLPGAVVSKTSFFSFLSGIKALFCLMSSV